MNHTQFPLTKRGYADIFSKPIYTNHLTDLRWQSFNGRKICLINILTTPLKVVSVIGKFALQLIQSLEIAVAIVTLNYSHKYASSIVAKPIDGLGYLAMEAIALPTRMIRTIVASILHPRIAMRFTSFPVHPLKAAVVAY